jgi:hypothetical protein
MKALALVAVGIPVVVLLSTAAHSQGMGSLSPQTGVMSRGGESHVDTPGTNSLGTAQSSGQGGGGQAAASVGDDPAVQAEERKVNQAVKSICRGC